MPFALIRPFLFLSILWYIVTPASAQDDPPISISFDNSGITANGSFTLFEGGTCGTIGMQGVMGQASLEWEIDVLKATGEVLDVILDGDDLDLQDFITPTFKCSAHIMNVKGSINSYLVTGDPNLVLEQPISGGVSYADEIEVYSNVATTIELPFSLSVGLAAVQTFCEPESSEAIARANLTGTLGGQSVQLSEEVKVENGGFLDNGVFTDSKRISVPVQPGLNVFQMQVSGELFVNSKVLGISDLGLIACGSNAAAVASNSLTVKHFTGPEGAPLHPSITITGRRTGINYVNPQTSTNCIGLQAPEVTTTDADCGLDNGSAELTTYGNSFPAVRWSTGQAFGTTLNNLPRGDYYVVVTQDSCTRIVEFSIDDPTAPAIDLPEDTILAETGGVLLDATATDPAGLQYAWSTGDTTASIQVFLPGIYELSVTATDGCVYTYQTQVISSQQYLISEGDIVSDGGFLYDDGGPEGNPKNDQGFYANICPATPGRFIQLNFSEVDVPTGNQNELSVFNGANTTLCPLELNIETPGVYTSSAEDGCLSVRFRNRFFNFGTGWEASFVSVDAPGLQPLCIKRIDSCGYTFTDSGGAEGPYGPEEYDVYYLCPENPGSEFAELTLDEVAIQNNDYLAVYDGLGVSCLIEAEVREPGTFIASEQSGGCLTVVFDSDPVLNGLGWDGTVSCTETPGEFPAYCDKNESYPEATNDCQDAPLIGKMINFRGVTSVRHSPNLLRNSELGAFSCDYFSHNNSFLRFVASADTVVIDYTVSGGTHAMCNASIEILVAENPSGCFSQNWEEKFCINTFPEGLGDAGTLVIPDMVPGNEYYIIMDGGFASVCHYTLNAIAGVAGCMLEVGEESVECLEDGRFFVNVPFNSLGDSTEYLLYEKNDLYQEVDTVYFIDDGASSVVQIGPYPAGRDYHLRISGGRYFDCAIELSGSAPCPAPCNLDASLEIRCDSLSDTFIVEGEIQSGVSPISITSAVYNEVLFPDDGNVFSTGVIPGLPDEDIEFYFTDNLMCNLVKSVSVADCLTSTSNPDLLSDHIEIFPNPSHSELHVQSNNLTLLKLRVIPMTGGTSMEYRNIDVQSVTAHSFSIESLPPGMYLLQVLTDKGWAAKKFVKI